MANQDPGQVITFYSYKGGTGRTMALANVACLLAARGGDRSKVLMVDWDLDAPGLHWYFRDHFSKHFGPLTNSQQALKEHSGLIDLFLEIERAAPRTAVPDPSKSEEEVLRLLEKIDLDRYLIRTDFESLWLLKAGRQGEDYAEKVNTFPWEDLYRRCPDLYRLFAEWLTSRFDYVLIDSRTGLSDISGICTMLLPEKLVVVFVPNLQNLKGVLEVTGKAAEYRRLSDDMRPFTVLPVPSRIDPSRYKLRETWRIGEPADRIEGYQPQFQEFLKRIYKLPDCDLTDYFLEVQIPHDPDYAFGEKIAVLIEQDADRFTMTRGYRSLTEILVSEQGPWESATILSTNAAAAPSPELAEAEQRQRAEQTFTNLPAEDQEIARRFLTRLIRLEEGSGDAPQRTWLTEWDRAAHHVVKSFANAEVLLLGEEEPAGQIFAELTDPSLIRTWPRLQNWLNEDRSFFLWRQRLRAASLAWRRSNRDEDLLLRGSALAEAESQMKSRPADFLAGETEFIEESRKLREGQRRRWALTTAAATLFTLIALVFVLQWQSRQDQVLRFESWGLPPEFVEWTGQLEVLKLPSAVNRVDWLNAKSLKHLDLSDTNVTDLDGLPSSLVSLDLSATQVRDLQGLPFSLQNLNLNFTSIQNLKGVPPGLVVLSLADTPIEDLTGLPASLESLTLEAARLESLDKLPRSLKELNLASFQGRQLPSLPATLESLSLIGTKLRTLSGLPISLDSLTLVSNSDLRLDSLPYGLSSLTIDGTRTPINLGDLPPSLRVLELRRMPVRPITGAPPTLREVTLLETSVTDLSWLPKLLRSLTLGQQEQEDLRVFPGGLTSLTLPWTRNLDLGSLPRSLQFLDLSFSSLGTLKGLPPDLETLILNKTDLLNLGSLPPDLRTLELRWTRVQRLSNLPATLESLDVSGCKDLMELGRLPHSLRELNISQTRISRLDGLPLGLRSLDISESRVQNLKGLPPHLVSLRLNSQQLRRIQRLPRFIRELYVVDALARPQDPSSEDTGNLR